MYVYVYVYMHTRIHIHTHILRMRTSMYTFMQISAAANSALHQHKADPPKNVCCSVCCSVREIAQWPNTRVVKRTCYVFKNKMGSIVRSSGTVFHSLLYLNSRLGFKGLK